MTPSKFKRCPLSSDKLYSAAVLSLLVQLQTTFFCLQVSLRRRRAQALLLLHRVRALCTKCKVTTSHCCRDGGQHRARRFRHPVMCHRNPFFLVRSSPKRQRKQLCLYIRKMQSSWRITKELKVGLDSSKVLDPLVWYRKFKSSDNVE